MPSRALYKLAFGAGLATFVVATGAEAPSRSDEPKKDDAKKVEERRVVVDKAAVEKAEMLQKEVLRKQAVDKARAAVPVAKVAIDDAVVNQWEQQFAPMFQQLFKGELHFMRLVTDATKAQYDAVAADGDAAVKSAVRKYANAMQRGGDYADPRIGLTDAISKSIEKHFSEEQAARYRKEIELRNTARKKLIVTNLVAMIDRVLLLQPDQRQKINDILANNWHESWNQTQILMYGGRYMPLMPDDKINPILSDKQREVWRTISKNQVRFGPNFGFNRGFEIEEEVWDEGPPAKKPDKPVPPKDKP
jgi:hypothetical protein